MKDQIMKIGELAAFFNVSPRAIRIYEKKGIIKPVQVDRNSGYRYYSADQVKRLKIVLELKALGFSLKEIKKILDGGLTGKNFIETLVKKKAAWRNVISAAENKIDAIHAIIARLSESESIEKFNGLTEEERARLLARMVCVEDLCGQNILSEAIWL